MEVTLAVEGDNLVFAGKEGRDTVSALYLAPRLCDQGVSVCEIKNVATNVHHRRKGYMDTLMKEAFACMQSEEEPYTFLQTSDKNLFDKYGFQVIFEDRNFVCARIIDVRSFLSLIKTKKEFVLAIKIKDKLLPENEGLYLLHSGPLGGNITPVRIANADMVNAEGERLTAECECDADDLVKFAFGEAKAADTFKIYVKSRQEELCRSLDDLIKIVKPYLCVEMSEEMKKKIGLKTEDK